MFSALAWAVPLLPLAAALLIAIGGRALFRGQSHLVCIAGLLGSFGCALALLAGPAEIPAPGWRWLSVGDFAVGFDFHVDALAAQMLAMVTGIATLVAIYSAGYMHGDRGYLRFFAFVALFVAAMCVLVLASNLVLLYLGWEAVGLCSYLLIGHYHGRASAAAAARKAFLVNRIGDLGLLLGIFWIRSLVLQAAPGAADPLAFATIFRHAAAITAADPNGLTAACLLLFAGAVGKSAQFPLHVWLPDAMEGPSPVSALIHAATMVTAGVYLVARLQPVLEHAPLAQAVIAGIGAFTALLAAGIALTQHDLKRVLAYSTASQLGFMFAALGASAGSADKQFGAMCVAAAMFHLLTHAFFKALLFLSAGSVMHAMGDVIDMRRFGGLRKALPFTHAAFLCGALALAGFPLLSGFWSKDDILAVVGHAAKHSPYAWTFAAVRIALLATAFLTAFYTFRAYFLTFHGTERFPEEAGHHPHEATPAMLGPLAVLAALALGAGLVLGPGLAGFGYTIVPPHLLAHFLERLPSLKGAATPHAGWGPMLQGTVAALGGLALAHRLYVQKPELPAEIAAALGPLAKASEERFRIDEAYHGALVAPAERLAAALPKFDRDRLGNAVEAVGLLPALAGRGLGRLQSGYLQTYAAWMLLGAGALPLLLLAGSAAAPAKERRGPPPPAVAPAAVAPAEALRPAAPKE